MLAGYNLGQELLTCGLAAAGKKGMDDSVFDLTLGEVFFNDIDAVAAEIRRKDDVTPLLQNGLPNTINCRSDWVESYCNLSWPPLPANFGCVTVVLLFLRILSVFQVEHLVFLLFLGTCS